jgi:hypothetical protein
MESAVLFLIFSRPDTTARVFERIREARPPRLYVAADGPRETRSGEAALCDQTRAIVNQVDWPCEVRTLFRASNLGCKRAISGALDWFFEHEEAGVILEDDCLPEPSFFAYCDEMLRRYAHDPKVMCISGDTFLPDSSLLSDASYYFTSFGHIWGWASWRRAWQGYDVDMKEWTPGECWRVVAKVFPDNKAMQRIWFETYEKVAKGLIDTWDYQWNYHCWKSGGMSSAPRVNLISNIGFDGRATHTTDPESRFSKLATAPLDLPIRHLNRVVRLKPADDWEAQALFEQHRYTWRRFWGRRLKARLRGQQPGR